MPNDGSDSETVDVIYKGYTFTKKNPDENGGIFVELPIP